MFGSPAPTPAPPPVPDPLPSAPTFASGGNKNKPSGTAGAYAPKGGTLLTSGEGVTAPSNTTKKSLLGQ